MRAMTASGIGAEHDRRQDEMMQRVEEGAGLIRQQRVDRHEAGRPARNNIG